VIEFLPYLEDATSCLLSEPALSKKPEKKPDANASEGQHMQPKPITNRLSGIYTNAEPHEMPLNRTPQ